MSTSDKISWIGGMMGLFTGFSVISGLEILYWLWFKILINKKNSVAPAPQSNDNESEEEGLNKNVDDSSDQNLRAWRKKNSAIFFDALFNDIEEQDVSKVKKKY